MAHKRKRKGGETIDEELRRQVYKEVALAFQLQDFGHEDASGNFHTTAQKIRRFEDACSEAADNIERLFAGASA